MSGLFDSLLSGNDDVVSKVAESLDGFPVKLSMYKNKAVNDFTRYNTGLDESIAKIATADNLTDMQIQRIVEEANSQVYLIKYAELKNSPTRQVEFPLASLSGVKDVIDGKKKDETITKKAGWGDDGEDKLDFLNYSAYETSGLGTEKRKDLRTIMAEKIATELKGLKGEFEKLAGECTRDLFEIAEALIKYDRMFKNSQEIFFNLCKEASMSKADQVLIKEAIAHKTSMMEIDGDVPAGYSLEINLVDSKERNPYSLKGYSLLKTAKDNTPSIMVGDKKLIKSVNSLVEIAKDLKSKKNKLMDINVQKQKILKPSKG